MLGGILVYSGSESKLYEIRRNQCAGQDNTKRSCQGNEQERSACNQ